MLDTEALGYLRLIEEATGARVRDCCVVEGKVVVLVEPADLPRAVGPGGARIEQLKERLRKEIMVVAYSDDPATLARNLFFAFHPRSVALTPKGRGRHATVTVDPAWKARAIGRGGHHLKIARAVLMRHTDVESVSVA
ncbi:MAG: NusA-like transcription termination signal-binding factor [Thermoplasmata archaeon]